MALTEDQLTDRQKLAAFSADWGCEKIHLRPHEYLIKCANVNGMLVVAIQRYRTEETSSELKFVAKGRVLRTWALNRHGAWIEQHQVVTWESDYKPEIVSKFGRRTPKEHRDSELWAADCARPGTGRYPMDSFYRVAESPEGSPDRMRKHWGL